MKARYFLAGLVVLTAVLVYTGGRYKQHRRVELTVQLKEALEANQKQRAIRLLQLGADPNGKGKYGWPLIFHVLDSSYDDASVMRAFVAAGADVNAIDYAPHSDGRVTLLSQIGCYSEEAYPAQIEGMKCLLKAGADPNLGPLSVILSNAGPPSWIGAAWSNPCEVALLLQYGARLRPGDATELMHIAENTLDKADYLGGQDSAFHMLRICAKLPLPTNERRALIRRGLKELAKYHYQGALEHRRLETLAFLQRERRTTQSGSQHH
ncbi:hypothetical protein IAD21_01121 [Abditibacteriota bacterium]|nr:hypothetical protein IAD21_01121 [Abditibacteriota bacterium]